MSKKDYILIAEAIKSAQTSLLYATTNAGETRRSVEHVAQNLAFTLAIENPLFNTERFLSACGVEGAK